MQRLIVLINNWLLISNTLTFVFEWLQEWRWVLPRLWYLRSGLLTQNSRWISNKRHKDHCLVTLLMCLICSSPYHFLSKIHNAYYKSNYSLLSTLNRSCRCHFSASLVKWPSASRQEALDVDKEKLDIEFQGQHLCKQLKEDGFHFKYFLFQRILWSPIYSWQFESGSKPVVNSLLPFLCWKEINFLFASIQDFL